MKEDKKARAAGMYPGVAVDIADAEKVTTKEVKQETKLENNDHHDLQ